VYTYNVEKIKILHVFASLDRGGAETMVMNYFRLLNKEKFQFNFLALNSKKNYDFEEEIKELGGLSFKIPKPNFLNFRILAKEFDRILKLTKPNIVHFHYISLSRLLFPICKKNKIPIIVHAHNSKLELDLFYLIRLSNLFYVRKRADYLLSCSTDSSKLFFGKYIGLSKILYNSIDYKKYSLDSNIRDQVRDKLKIEGNFVIGNVGRFFDQKNHIFLLEIFIEILKIKPNSKLILIGDGPLKKKILSFILKNGLKNNVILLGKVNNVSHYLNAFDVFLMPSKYEGLPLSIIEAQVNNLPVFLSDNITREVIISTNIHFISLKNDHTYWAFQIVKNSNNRLIYSLNLDRKFDTVLNIRALEKIYYKISH
jgi:glycosyltransferase involved in cell wall biosynthesis